MCVAAAGLGAPGASAQAPGRAFVGGRIVRLLARDTIPVPGAPVVLHRVSRAAQGPIDTVRSTPAGGFGLRFVAESSATYLVSVRWAGIEYFSDPIVPGSGRADAALLVVVADTAADAAVGVRRRTLLIGRVDPAGARDVLDWFALENASGLTRVSPDSLRPAWAAPLPPGAEGAAIADTRVSEFSPDAIEFRRDSLLIWAPLSPGGREILVRYRLPSDLTEVRIPFGGGADSVQLLVEEASARVRGGGLASAGRTTLEGRAFGRWTGRAPPGAQVEIRFAAPLLTPGRLLRILVALGAIAFVVLATWQHRRAALATGSLPLALADRAARLDLRYAGRRDQVSAEEWQGYEVERARLGRELAAALAALRHRS